MKVRHRNILAAAFIVSFAAAALAQAPAQRKGPAPRLVLWVTSDAWQDGGVIPMRNAAHGENQSPAFAFHWNLGTEPASAPQNLQSYAVIFHDVENSSNKTTTDTLHWTAFNIPGTAKGLPEGLGAGDLPDGTRNGPGIAARQGKTPAYFGPGAGPGLKSSVPARVDRPARGDGPTPAPPTRSACPQDRKR